jgi:hypothetical protein
MRSKLRLILAGLTLAACSDERQVNLGPVSPRGDTGALAYLSVSNAQPNPGDVVTITLQAQTGIFQSKLGSFAADIHLPDGVTFIASREIEGGGSRAMRIDGSTIHVAAAATEGFKDVLFVFDARVDVPEALTSTRLELREATRTSFDGGRTGETAAAPSTLLWGDVTGDGAVAASDAQAILTASLGAALPTGHQLTFGDANCDGVVGALDALIVLSKTVGTSVTQFCVGAAAKVAISGEIRDVETFTAVSGAKVSLEATGGVDAGVALPREATTDANGAYALYNNIPSGTYAIAVTGTNFKKVQATNVAVTKDVPQKVDATLLKTTSTTTGKFGSLSGRVLQSNGAASVGAAVQLSGGVQTNGVVKATTTGSDGTYTFTGVSLLDETKIPIVSFSVSAKATSGETGSVTGITVGENEIKANVNVTLAGSAPTFTSYFTEGFESGIPGTWTKTGLWNARGTTAITNKAVPQYVKLAPNDATGGAVPLAFTGTNAAWFGSPSTGNFIGTQSSFDFDLSGGTSAEAFLAGLLTTPSISIPSNATKATLAFDSWFEIESVNPNSEGFDIMEVTVTDVGTGITTSMTRLNPFEDPAAEDRAAIPFSSGGFNRVPVWVPVYVNLDAFKGKTVKVGFCFQTVDGLYNGFRGWLIDNVRVTNETPAGGMAGMVFGTGSLQVGRPNRKLPTGTMSAGTTISCVGSIQTVGVASVTVSPTPVTLNLNQTAQLLATPKDANGTAVAGKEFTWTSSNTSVATVSSLGLVTAKATGSATITATVLGDTPSGTASVTVNSATMSINAGNNQSTAVGTNVSTAPSVKITSSSGTPIAGHTVTFAVGSGGGSITGATTTTNSSGVATVGSWQLGASAGTNTLTATASGVSGSPQTFTATGTSAGFNLTVDGFYITQATQTMLRDVPLVAGRPAFLRVFVKASQTNTATPAVKAELIKNNVVVKTFTITAPGSSVPTSIAEGTLTSSWNVAIPAADMQTGLSIAVTVDPTNAVTEVSESDNAYPTTVLDVRAVPTLNVMWVPVTQPGNITAQITDANKDAFVDFARRVYPVAEPFNVNMHAAYSYGSTLSGSYDATWSTLLSEIYALNVAEKSGSKTWQYYGIIHPTYSFGGTGLGYLGLPAAIGVDWTGSINGSNTDWRAMTVAHEWGHNFNRKHIDCGGPSGPDLSYPYATNSIGAFGYDVFKNALIPQSTTVDLMSYCTPLFVSDYTYKAVLNYRAAATGPLGEAEGGVSSRGLLVWGQIRPDGITLEPSFEVSAPPTLPERAGPYSVQALDAEGKPIFDLSFEGAAIDHLAGVRHFAYVVPLPTGIEAPASMRLNANGRIALQRSAAVAAGAQGGASTAPPDARLSRVGGRSRLEWDAKTYPVAMIRDAATGQILSFARSGAADVMTTGANVEVIFSDGTKTTRRTMKPPL